MQIIKTILLFSFILTSLGLTTSCRRDSNAVWEDTKTAGRHLNRGMRSLGGKNGASRQVGNRNDFYSMDDDQSWGAPPNDYVPLSDDPNAGDLQMNDYAPQPRETPGEPGSSIPGIEAFQDPSTNPRLARIFRNIKFGYNSSLVKGEDNLMAIRDISDYMRQNPNTYVFVEGHCDERGPAAYNLALGSHRSNSVRSILINEGVNPDNVFTISYGNERPLIQGHDEEAWSQNRRAEFKVYQR